MLGYKRAGVPSDKGHGGRTLRVFGAIALAAVVILLASCAGSYDDSWDTANDLLRAFVDADVDAAKRVTVPEQWARIAGWMEGREGFRCRRGDWETTGGSTVGGSSAPEEEWEYTAVYQCGSTETPYCLAINDIVVRNTEDGWRVTDWGTVCEAFDYAHACDCR